MEETTVVLGCSVGSYSTGTNEEAAYFGFPDTEGLSNIDCGFRGCETWEAFDKL